MSIGQSFIFFLITSTSSAIKASIFFQGPQGMRGPPGQPGPQGPIVSSANIFLSIFNAFSIIIRATDYFHF